MLIVESWELDISYRSWPLVTLFVCDNALQYVIQSESLMNDRTNNHQFCCLLIDFWKSDVVQFILMPRSRCLRPKRASRRTRGRWTLFCGWGTQGRSSTTSDLSSRFFSHDIFAILCTRAKVIVVRTVTIPLASVTSFFSADQRFCWRHCQWTPLCRANRFLSLSCYLLPLWTVSGFSIFQYLMGIFHSWWWPGSHGGEPGQIDRETAPEQEPHVQNICRYLQGGNARWEGIARCAENMSFNINWLSLLSGFAQLSIADWQHVDIPEEGQEEINRTAHLIHMWSLPDSWGQLGSVPKMVNPLMP